MQVQAEPRATDDRELEGNSAEKLRALSILSEVTASLADEDDVEELLGRFLGTMIRLAEASAGAVRVLTSDGLHMRLVGSLGLPPDLVERERVVPVDCGYCGSAVLENHSRYEIDLHPCALRTGHDYFDNGCQAMLIVPLQHGGKLLGTFSLFLPKRFELPEDVALLFRSIAEHLGMALENARLKRENLRITLMGERQMMAAEVHDSLAQTCAYMKMRMSLLQEALCDQDTELASKYAGDVGQALDEAYLNLRELLSHFRSGMDPLGLLHALDRVAATFQERTGIGLEYLNRITDLRLSVDQEAQVFYILQEALANVVRHAGASRARLILEGVGDHYVATVEDNGKGRRDLFAHTHPGGRIEEPAHQHFGLTIMRERAQKIGGQIDIATLPEGGTRVRLTFPVMAGRPR
ncbi:MAG: ATP-binding protein [Sterolibacterium sp.]